VTGIAAQPFLLTSADASRIRQLQRLAAGRGLVWKRLVLV
jgi:hypothetical protein